ncbi:MAG: family 78 glycoside hydrolase catalytic domain [Ktedonobacteraceae bacterium]|nr:family 78 glycoside hydrolase catalytic domain [Ktedonobacteraceae bacterium]
MMIGTITPTRLHCEYLVNPLGIDSIHPRLSWMLQATQRAQSQLAYQILVASSEAALAVDRGDLWDSGKVDSAQSVHIVYAGAALTSGQRCWWKVRVWDQHGVPSAYSEPAYWEMGLLQSQDWRAQWIGLELREQETHAVEDDIAGLVASPYLRKALTLSGTLRKARLYITAKGLYEAYINGQRIGEAQLAPGWTDFEKRIQYQTYDVTSLLQPGENALGAILGTGWYCGYVGMPALPAGSKGYARYGEAPRLLFQLQLEYTDGSSETVTSDGSWQGATGPIVYADLLQGEAYDARRELGGWNRAGYAGERWQPVVVEERDMVQLVAEQAEPVKVTEEIKPQALREVSPGVYVVDMGQNMVGWVRLRVQGAAGTRVQLRFAEMLNPDGTIYTTNLRRARQTDTYILKGDGEEIFEPRFTFHGFRYVEVEGYPGQLSLEAITGCVVHSATPSTGSFECSSPMVNQLQRNIVWGQRGNFLSVPTDCPQRDERLGWMGDAQIFVRTASYNMHVAPFFSKWMTDVVDGQSAGGAFPDVAPRACVLSDGAPAWGDAGVIVPWTIYKMYGDTRIIEQNYDAMASWIEYIRAANPHLLWANKLGNNYGDWLSIEADTPKEVLGTAYFAYDALLMSQIASALGRHEDAQKYTQLFQGIRAAFCAAYVSKDGRVQGETQTCYVLALHMQLLPEALRPLAARHLIADIEKKGWHLSTGFVGVGYLCPVLTEHGYTDVAYRLLHNDTFPSWGYSIKHGATTIWERWDGWTDVDGFQNPRMNSFNHYSLGSVGQWLYQYVAGIDVEEHGAGFQRFVVRPYPHQSLNYVRAEYHALTGTISSEWRHEAGALVLRIIVPANTMATVYVPASARDRVTESSGPAHEAEGVTYLREESGRVVYKVMSGSYEFHSV